LQQKLRVTAVVFFAAARKITSCTFIARSIAAFE
jgi:hypothetical protein